MKLPWISVALVLAACAHARPRMTGSPDWVTGALSYEHSDTGLLLAEDEDAFGAFLAKRQQRQDQQQGVAVSEGELVVALASGNVDYREAAEIALIIKGGVTERVFQAIVDHYRSTDPFFTRYYSMQALASLRDRPTREASRAIAGMLLGESNDAVRNAALPVIPLLDPEDGASVLVEYMRTGSPRLVRLAYAIARSKGIGLTCDVRARLTRMRARTALVAISLIEGAREGAGKDTEYAPLVCP